MLDAWLAIPSGARIVLCLLVAFALARPFRALPSSNARHVFSIGVGSAFGLAVYSAGFIHPLLSAVVSYAALILLPRSVSHIFVCLFTFGYTVAAHVTRAYIGWVLVWDAAQMLITLKLSSLAINYHDAARPESELAQLPPRRRAQLVQHLPAPLEFFGYVLFYIGFLAGPIMEFNEYLAYTAHSCDEEKRHRNAAAKLLETTLLSPDLPAKTREAARECLAAVRAPEAPVAHVPAALGAQVEAVIAAAGTASSAAADALRQAAHETSRAAALHEQGLRVAPWSVHGYHLLTLAASLVGYQLSLLAPVSDITTDAFFELPFARRLATVVLTISCCKFKYVAWSAATLAAGAAGLGYNPRTSKWDRLRNVELLLCEIPVNFRVHINNWNIRVAEWINTYVYNRVALRKGKPTVTSQAASFAVSALWHGVHVGYYTFFLTGVLYLELAKALRRWLRPKFVLNHDAPEDRAAHPMRYFLEPCGVGASAAVSWPRWLLALAYHVAATLLTWVMLTLAGVSFNVLDMHTTLRIWASFWYPCHLPTTLLLACLLLRPRSRRSLDVGKVPKLDAAATAAGPAVAARAAATSPAMPGALASAGGM